MNSRKLKDITGGVFTRMVPRAAIIVYRSRTVNKDLREEEVHDCSLEVRPIRTDGSFGAGKPVSRGFITSVLRQLSTEDSATPHGRIPSNMLYADCRAGRQRLVWYTPPGRRMRYFEEQLGLEDGEYSVPGCVYTATEQALQVYAFKGTKPHEHTPLLWGPFFNAYDDHICLGSAKGNLRDNTWEELQAYWEGLFWNSKDSHLGAGRPTKDNLVLTLRRYKDIPFDCGELNPRGLRLSDLFPKESR